MNNVNKTVGKIVVISLTIILGSLTFMLGFVKAFFTLAMGLAIVFLTAISWAALILLVLYLHYLFGNNTYHNFLEYIEDL